MLRLPVDGGIDDGESAVRLVKLYSLKRDGIVIIYPEVIFSRVDKVKERIKNCIDNVCSYVASRISQSYTVVILNQYVIYDVFV